MTHQFFASVGRADITPPIGIAQANWGAQLHERAAGIDLPLWATALALRSGDVTTLIIDIDIAWLQEPLALTTREAVSALTGVPEERIRLSYTHTHSGPTTTSGRSLWTSAGAEMVDPYSASLPHKIAGAAWEAVRALQPARLASGTGHAEIAVNRRFQRPEDGAVIVGRNWEGPVDHDVTVLRIDAIDGAPIAAVVGYACHPITVGPDNDQITPDYPGALKRVVESATGATCLFLQGACGNIGPVRGVARNGAHEYKLLARQLGLAASATWSTIDPTPRQDRYEGTLESGAPLAIYADEPLPERDTRIRIKTRTIKLPLRTLPPPDEMDAAYQANLDRLNELRATNGDENEIKLVTMACKRTAMRARLARDVQDRTHMEWDLQVIAIGDDLALVAMPGEPFIEIGLGVKRGSPFRQTFFSGYSNIGWSYMPTADAYALGGYEVEITPFDPTAAQVVIDESIALLNEVRNS
jgi:hypothetical protein